MPLHRFAILIFSVVLAGGSLGITGVHALRIRSESYRREVERNLTAFFELPCEVGRIRGRTFSSRSFEDVALFLSDRRDRVFSCRTAIWHEPAAGGDEENRLEVVDGFLTLGSDRWERGDYGRVIESGLRHDFTELHLSRVDMSDFEIAFARGDLAVRCRQASGSIDLRDPEMSVARLQAYELNGFPVSGGVRIYAEFSPGSGMNISKLELSISEVPLAGIGLEGALGGEVTRGRFAGSVRILQNDGDGHEIRIRGLLDDADLSELTRNLPFGPLVGDFSVNVHEATFCGKVLTQFEGQGRVTNLSFDALAPLFGFEGLSGTASFRLDPVDIGFGHVQRLRLDGDITDLLLQEVLQHWGRGTATGQLAVRINNLDIVDDQLKSGDIELSAVPPKTGAGYIDRKLLLSLAKNAFNVNWPAALPEELLPARLEYERFGMRLLVRDNILRILGTHGSAGKTILTIKAFGRPIGLVKEQAGTIDLGPYISKLLDRIRRTDPAGVRRWWETELN